MGCLYDDSIQAVGEVKWNILRDEESGPRNRRIQSGTLSLITEGLNLLHAISL